MKTGETGPKQADPPAPTAATLVGALYQLAADPDDWADFLAHLAQAPSPGDPDQATLAAMVSGSEQVAHSAAAARPRDIPAEATDLAVLAVSNDGRRVIGNGAAQRALLGRLIARPGEASSPENLETLRGALARLAAGGGSPCMVRLHVADEAQPVFAYAMAFDRLPASLRAGLAPQPKGAIAIVGHASGSGEGLGGELSEAFGLTPAEVRLTLALGGGASLQEIARDTGVSFFTVRNQLNAVFEKLGVNRQTELIRALTELGQIWRRVDGGERRGSVRPPPGFAPAPQQLRLADGRSLTFRTYGEPCGRPVLVFHGGLGASLLPPGTDDAARRLNLRLVVPERAGVGHSPVAQGQGAASAADDMAAVVRKLGLGQPQFLSFTSGAHVALATAAAAPDVASRILMLSPRPPMATEGPPSASPMVGLQRRLRAHPWLAEAFFAIVRLRLSRAIVGQIMQASAVSPGDAAYLASHPETYDLITLGLHEALTRTGQGTAVELAQPPAAPAAALGPLPTVTVWHGAEDAYAKPAEVEAWLGPTLSEITVFPGIGNYTALKHWDEALNWLAATNRG